MMWTCSRSNFHDEIEEWMNTHVSDVRDWTIVVG